MQLTRIHVGATIVGGTLLLLGCTPRNAGQDPSAAELATLYKKAHTDTEKRDICIRAVDLGYIRRLGPLDPVRQLCGSDFEAQYATTEDGTTYGIVHLSPQIVSSRTSGQPTAPVLLGWYMVVYYEDDVIRRYEFSKSD